MGLLRLLLALTVLEWHYSFNAWKLLFSYSAVFIFMMISGFYISLVLDQRYGKDLRGTFEFYSNRLLRLLPAYWTVLLVCRFFRPDAPIAWNDFLVIPQGFLHLEGVTAGNLYLGQMYTVTLELAFYVIAPLIVLRGLPWLLGAFAAAVIYTGATWWAGVNAETWQYHALPGTLLYFFTGMLAYRFYIVVTRWQCAPLIGYTALPLIVLVARLTPSGRYVIWTNDAGVFAFYGLCAALIPFLFIASKNCRWDRLIGDLSYPLYIVHVPVIWLVQGTPWLAGGEHGHGGLAVLSLSLAFAVALYVLVDRPVDRWRHWATKRLAINREQNSTNDVDNLLRRWDRHGKITDARLTDA